MKTTNKSSRKRGGGGRSRGGNASRADSRPLRCELLEPRRLLSSSPKIAVIGVKDGDKTPSVAEHSVFGTVMQGQARPTQTYTVSNTGQVPLALGSVILPAGYHLDEGLPPSLAPGIADTFTVSLQAAALGTYAGDISFTTNVTSANPFNFRITGTVVADAPRIVVQGFGQTIANNDAKPAATDGTNFGAAPLSQSVLHGFVIVNTGLLPLVLTGSPLVRIQGGTPADFHVNQPPVTTLAPGGRTAFSVQFSPLTLGSRTTTLVIGSNDGSQPSYSFAISGTGLDAPPVLTGVAPAPGLRVKQVAPEYAGTGVYHTLYLPTDWTPGKLYPVIVEFAPNKWGPAGTAGTVDDTMLGYYESGGKGFIWVTMPIIEGNSNSTYNWGGDFDNAKIMQPTADYVKLNLIRIMQTYYGDTSKVFVTGFSRGAVATSAVGLRDDSMADIWLGFIPHSFGDGNATRLNRVDGRASFITYGNKGDNGASSSVNTYNYLVSRGYPTQGRVIPGIGHTDTWIRDDAAATSVAVRQDLRNWITNVMANRPGTHSISGTVTDAEGNPVPYVILRSGDTHWTCTNAAGQYVLAGLTDSSRSLMAVYGGARITIPVTVAGSNVANENFTYIAGAQPSIIVTPAGGLALKAAVQSLSQTATPAATSPIGSAVVRAPNADIARTVSDSPRPLLPTDEKNTEAQPSSGPLSNWHPVFSRGKTAGQPADNAAGPDGLPANAVDRVFAGRVQFA